MQVRANHRFPEVTHHQALSDSMADAIVAKASGKLPRLVSEMPVP
jgi:hypothetical protein